MRKSDLRVGAIYRGKTGGLRQVIRIAHIDAINRRIHWRQVDGSRSGSTWAELFAKWATEEVTESEGRHG